MSPLYRYIRQDIVHKYKSRADFARRTEEALGCTRDEFVARVIPLLKPGMKLSNIGRKWSFQTLLKEAAGNSRKRCLHYTNWFPVFRIDKKNPHSLLFEVELPARQRDNRVKETPVIDLTETIFVASVYPTTESIMIDLICDGWRSFTVHPAPVTFDD